MIGKKLKVNELKKLGIQHNNAINIAQSILEMEYPDLNKKNKLKLLERIVQNADRYREDQVFGELIVALDLARKSTTVEKLKSKKRPYRIFGSEHIDPTTLDQMDIAMQLPVAEKGALMPDAHLGYGLPIGGVLATRNEVIPYGVGVDIGCRLCLSLFPVPLEELQTKRDMLKQILMENTRFGFGGFQKPRDHPVLERKEFQEIKVIRELKDKAFSQIGSSGGGNHFVEFGIVEVLKQEPGFDVSPGEYVALLSHSGSRGFGARLADYYTNLAMDICQLPRHARHLAWLSLDTQEGREYWAAMTLAGDYASANHQQIHDRIAEALGQKPIAIVENHHNFAWREKDEVGEDWIVHRKGATPAGKDDLGVIPGSMTLPGFIVKGTGNRDSLNSASHGAGRVMSRNQAKKTLREAEVRDKLRAYGVELIGGGLDEAPQVYKDIHKVMKAQHDLVEILGTFTPKIVRMCGDNKFKEVD